MYSTRRELAREWAIEISIAETQLETAVAAEHEGLARQLEQQIEDGTAQLNQVEGCSTEFTDYVRQMRQREQRKP